MDLIGTDSDDSAVFLNHSPNLPCVLPLLDNVVVKLIPERRCSKLRAWNVGQRVKEHAINVQAAHAKNRGQKEDAQSCG